MRIVWAEVYGVQVGSSPENVVEYRGSPGEAAEVPDDIGELLVGIGAATQRLADAQVTKPKTTRRSRGA